MTRHHIIISGTGRAGTTFLIQLLTELGLDTGFPKGLTLDLNSRAGMELDIRDPHAPYVIKSPWLCDYLDDVLKEGESLLIMPLYLCAICFQPRKVDDMLPTKLVLMLLTCRVVLCTQLSRNSKKKF